MGLSFWQIAIVVLLFVLLFGRGKISDLMGDVAKGIKSFKKGLSEEDTDVAAPEEPKIIEQKTETAVNDKKPKKSKS
ncbi:MAG: twin-arginine translocase TatA/TatE family subunit [Alphaproteobacteria bacterium]|nr:twin-arginine translocase TatA/TatE family subunit [Alphaproteobacteria bacterium]